MSLFDALKNKVIGAMTGQGGDGEGVSHTALVSELIEMVRSKGLDQVIASFDAKGLGDIVKSWIGTGSNLPISAEQIREALGADSIAGMASKIGIPPEQISGILSKILPGLVDQLTPNGKLDDASSLLSSITGDKTEG